MLPSTEPSLPATPVGAYRQHGGDAQLVQASLSVGVVEGVVQHESRASHVPQELPGGMGELHSRVARALVCKRALFDRVKGQSALRSSQAPCSVPLPP